MENKVAFEVNQFNRIFPFYIQINSESKVESVGKTLEKLCPGSTGKPLNRFFRFTRPEIPEQDFISVKSLINQMVIIECNNKQKTTLRGQVEWMEDTNNLIFLGSPWFGSMEQVIENNLSLHDFAYHDPMIDLLHVLKTQEITTDDLKHLLSTVNKQKNDLKKAAKEIQDIALFPTQNPDPLIRIDLQGNILQENPVAQELTYFEYDQEIYPANVFWKMVLDIVDQVKERSIVEAVSGGETYSFVVKPLPENGYFNIYGRKITDQKKIEIQLQILSSIAAQNTHGVVIADNEGKIEWVNSSFEEMTGYKLEEMIGKKPGHLLQGPGSDPETVAYLSRQISKGEPFICEILNYSKANKAYWLRIQGQALKDNNGQISKYFAIEEDITIEKENQKKIREFETRFRTALEKIGDYVWEHDFVSGHTRFSKKENHFIGVSTDAIEKNEKLWWDSVMVEDRHLLEENDQKYQSGEIDNHVLEYRVIHYDGSVKWVLDRGVVIEKDAIGKPLLIIGTHTDITRQKTLELELGATANRLTSLIQNLYSGVLLENENRTIGLLNQQFCDLFQIPVKPEELIGTDCSQSAEQSKHLFRNPDVFVERIGKVLEDKKLIVNEHLEMKNGKHLHRDFIPIWNDGVYTGHLWLYTDITEQINADQKLEKQRIFYEQILNNTPADIAVFDQQHKYLFLNPQAIKNPELRAWMIGKKDEDYIARKKLPTSIAEKRSKLFQTALDTKELHSFEEELKQPDGTSRYILRNLYPVLNQNNEVDIVVGYGVDVTNIKMIQHQIEESEKRYRDVIENSLALITTHDMEGKFITVNPMVGKTYGYSDSELIGKPIVDFIPENDKAFFFEKYLPKIKEHKQASGIFRVQNKKGEIVYTLYNNFLKEEPGRSPYVIGFAVDITDRIQAEKELKIAQKATEELAQTKQNFLANMSHEIRTPMNAIMGMSNQLTKTLLSDQQKFYLNTIHTATDNLLVIINDILDLSKIEAGKLSIEKIAFDPKKVIASAMQVLMHKAEEKGVQLTNSFCDERISKVLIGDPHRMNQVLLNLLSNAIKFTDTGAVDLRCEVLKDASAHQVVRVKVIDTGIGMDASYVKNLFEKFNQEDISVSRRFGGTGLGMSITKQLIQLMGGKIDVASKKNEGTTVTFEIHFEKGNLKQLVTINPGHINSEIITGKRILVVDDNEMNRLVASTILNNYGADIIEAENGKQAVELTSEKNPAIVLMDLQMPILNGIEATKHIREKGSKVPIIALTANAIKGENEKCIAAGMNDYISKPYTEEELIQKLVKWLEEKRPEDLFTQEEDKELRDADERLYDLSGLEEISQGNQSFIHKMVDLFCDLTPGMVQEMIEAFKTDDLQRMGDIAHKMKPSIDNLRIISLKEDIRVIEKGHKENIAKSELADALKKVENITNQVINKMRQ